MRSVLIAAVVATFAASAVVAQETSPRFELGLTAPHVVSSDDANTDSFAPGASGIGLSAGVFLGERWVVSPSVTSLTIQDGGLHSVELRTDVRRFLRPEAVLAPYLFGSGASFLRRANRFQSSASDFALGGGAGLRLRLDRLNLNLSLEGRYDRWLTSDVDQFGLGIGFGIPLGNR